MEDEIAADELQEVNQQVALFEGAMQGSVEHVAGALNAEPGIVNARTHSRETPLLIAARLGHLEVSPYVRLCAHALDGF